MRRFYACINRSVTHEDFSVAGDVYVFDSKKKRDSFCEKHPIGNVLPVTRKMAEKIVRETFCACYRNENGTPINIFA